MKKTMLMILAAIVLSQCSLLRKNEDNNDDELIALGLLLASNTCTIGGQRFVPSGSVTCSGGSASGTGTLIAVGDHDEFVSMFLNFAAGGGSTVDVLAFASSADLTGTGVGIRLNGTDARDMKNATVNANLVFPATSSICVEIHNEEGGHVMVNSICSGTETDHEYAGLSTSGNSWGFVLNNATISSVSINPGEVWGH